MEGEPRCSPHELRELGDLDLVWLRELARRGFAILALVAVAWAATGCGGRSPEESRRALYASTAELREDSAATAAFFETVLADSVQRERLARAILRNEGMRRTMTRELLADSLAELEGAGLPEWRAPAAAGAAAPAPGGGPAPGAATGPGAGDETAGAAPPGAAAGPAAAGDAAEPR
ncbi:MAG TPA: hypothetical protein VIC56_02940 [Gemmatimonadota bacterium]|jgi:hypothetical protein